MVDVRKHSKIVDLFVTKALKEILSCFHGLAKDYEIDLGTPEKGE